MKKKMSKWLKRDGTQKIKHIVVLVMENRSFEHIYGASNLKGTGISIDGVIVENDEIEIIPSVIMEKLHVGAPQCMLFDPGHEFEETQIQLLGKDKFLDPENFVKSALESKIENNVNDLCGIKAKEIARDVLSLCRPDQVPVLIKLAKNFVLCDNWRASVPSSTTANRLFFHAATSGGLITSPTSWKLIENYKDSPLLGYRFENGTLFDQLSDSNHTYKIYHGDSFPNVAMIHGMAKNLVLGSSFASFGTWNGKTKYEPGQFYHDAMNQTLPDYSFIEPHFGNLSTFANGNSHHPMGSLEHGESLIKNVYETLRNSKSWEDSLLIITYDESGGFYSATRPETTLNTGDDENYNLLNFDFKSLGLKVPALVISPWVPKNWIDHRNYEHCSVPKTVQDRFTLPPLTLRNVIARSLGELLLLDDPRTDCPTTLQNPGFNNSYVTSIIENVGK
jgi:phospholipase C